jgi:hypothetical protein
LLIPQAQVHGNRHEIKNGHPPFAVSAEDAIAATTFSPFRIGNTQKSVKAEINIDFGE